MRLSPWTMSRSPWTLTKRVYSPWKSSPSRTYYREASTMLRLKVASLTRKVSMSACWLDWSRTCRFATNSAKALSPMSAFPSETTAARLRPLSSRRLRIRMLRRSWLRSTAMSWVESPKLASKRNRPIPGGPIKPKWTNLHPIKRKPGR